VKGSVIRMLALVLCLLSALPARAQESIVDSVLWAGTAVEHDGAVLQAYRLARLMLDKALRDRNWTAAIEQQGHSFRGLPPAIIMDVDETILDNSPFEARRAKQGGTYDEIQWQAWVREAKAQALPGAVEFTAYAHSRGVTIFYVTNRAVSLKAATRANLEKDGFPFERKIDTLYCAGQQPGWGTDKTTRRAAIAGRFRILLLFGDDLGDFLSGAANAVARRRELATPYQDHWGTKWIALPNAMYGSWEAAINASQTNATEQQQRDFKDQVLERIGQGSSSDLTSR